MSILKRLEADFERVNKLCKSKYVCDADFQRRNILADRIRDVKEREKNVKL